MLSQSSDRGGSNQLRSDILKNKPQYDFACAKEMFHSFVEFE